MPDKPAELAVVAECKAAAAPMAAAAAAAVVMADGTVEWVVQEDQAAT